MALHNFIRLEAIIMGKLDGKVAVIAGASSGLGYAEAETFAREGAKVVIFARGEDKLMEKKAELEGKGYEVLALVADAGKQEDWNRVVSEAVARFGRIDILMNNAGIMSSEYAAEEQTFGENFKPEAFMAGVNQCFTSQLMGIFACWPELKKTHGCVVNTASEHALNTMVPLSGALHDPLAGLPARRGRHPRQRRRARLHPHRPYPLGGRHRAPGHEGHT